MKNKPVEMWIGVDPEDDTILTWSLALTRNTCRAYLANMSWGAARVRRVTLTLSPPKRGKK